MVIIILPFSLTSTRHHYWRALILLNAYNSSLDLDIQRRLCWAATRSRQTALL